MCQKAKWLACLKPQQEPELQLRLHRPVGMTAFKRILHTSLCVCSELIGVQAVTEREQQGLLTWPASNSSSLAMSSAFLPPTVRLRFLHSSFRSTTLRAAKSSGILAPSNQKASDQILCTVPVVDKQVRRSPQQIRSHEKGCLKHSGQEVALKKPQCSKSLLAQPRNPR